MNILGIDVGGSGIKGAPVDTEKGELIAERYRVETPQPATPQKVALSVKELVDHFNWTGKIGFGFPAAIKNGIIKTASNIDKSWIDVDAVSLFSEITKCNVSIINDADAAGLAEIHMGAGKGIQGTVLMITVGTGIGSALFHKGQLMPNTEFGHIKMGKIIAEAYTSGAVRKNLDLDWKDWGSRLGEFLRYIEFLLWPDLIIIGGGISKKFEKFEKYLETKTKVVPACFENNAGILGAAAAAI